MSEQYDQAYASIDERFTYLKNFRAEGIEPREQGIHGPTIYHVIICCKGVEGRGPLFAHPILYNILQTTWLELTKKFTSIFLDEIVIMPDHIHFLLWMDMQPERCYHRLPELGDILRAYESKSATRWIHWVKAKKPDWPAKIWQKLYDKRIILRQDVMTVRKYIRENPEKLYEAMNWEFPSHLFK
jgi:REP element-mobilizing transposase RayT